MAHVHILSAEQLAALRITPLGVMPNRARLARTLLTLEQGEVAAGAGLKRAVLSAIERGDYKTLPWEHASALANYYGAIAEDIFPPRESTEPIGTRVSDRTGHDDGARRQA